MKEIYMTLSDRIVAKVPQILWVDLDRGQNTGIETPAALLSLSYPSADDVGEGEQQVQLSVGVRLLFGNEYFEETAAVYPAQSREAMLGYMDIADAVTAALQGFGTPFMSPLSRRSQIPNLSGGIVSYSLQFSTTVFEYFE